MLFFYLSHSLPLAWSPPPSLSTFHSPFFFFVPIRRGRGNKMERFRIFFFLENVVQLFICVCLCSAEHFWWRCGWFALAFVFGCMLLSPLPVCGFNVINCSFASDARFSANSTVSILFGHERTARHAIKLWWMTDSQMSFKLVIFIHHDLHPPSPTSPSTPL